MFIFTLDCITNRTFKIWKRKKPSYNCLSTCLLSKTSRLLSPLGCRPSCLVAPGHHVSQTELILSLQLPLFLCSVYLFMTCPSTWSTRFKTWISDYSLYFTSYIQLVAKYCPLNSFQASNLSLLYLLLELSSWSSDLCYYLPPNLAFSSHFLWNGLTP